jgi:arginyl-tRNA--protein-N-Asp/Glu arginylyltransferase
MRVFHREFGYRYESYEFGYATYASLEEGDALSRAYEAGFLPHSADPSVRDLFYMARSVRIPLASWKITSENRRILKKFDGHFTSTVLTHEELRQDETFLRCFLAYFGERHGERVMGEERARGILATANPLRGVRYEKDSNLAGYVLEIVENGLSHYWYSCYTSAYASTSFGMWLMLDSVQRAKDEGREYVYLGTAYGAKGRYKTNFEPLQFWDGSSWNEDPTLLKTLIASAP